MVVVYITLNSVFKINLCLILLISKIVPVLQNFKTNYIVILIIKNTNLKQKYMFILYYNTILIYY